MHDADVPWVSVPLASASERVNETTDDAFRMSDLEGDDFLGLQMVEGFDVEQESDATGQHKRVRLVKAKPKKRSAPSKAAPALESTSAADDSAVEDGAPPKKKAKAAKKEPLERQESVTAHEPTDGDIDAALQAAREQGLLEDDDAGDDESLALDEKLPGWASLPLHPFLKKALLKLKFLQPTAVQAQALPPSLGVDGPVRDVVGIAQTGSGKTLAYGLPILQYIAENTANSMDKDRPLEALVLAPTRELALQVTTHLRAVIEAGGRFANVAAVCGGMSMQKQERVLEQHGGAHIVVATPGRLWDMLKQNDHLALRVRRARFLVIDEADRMVEAGHFAEMDAILGMVRRTKGAVVDANEEMQTFVYSATMSKSLQTNLKKAHWRRKQRKAEASNTLDDLLSRVDFRTEEPLVVELVPERHVAETLWEAKIECLTKDKDLYLYYILLRYPGRALVFVNSIDHVRRILPLLTNLGIAAYPLHGQLQQQQRLKNMDRFKKNAQSVLLATDVAARGIDIPGVDQVVHFQLPRTADTYVHRAGRTARAGHTGISIALIEPKEQRLWRDIWRQLQRDDTVTTLPVEYSFLAPIRERLALAREIDSVMHTQNKASYDNAWLRNLAEEAQIAYDSDDSDPDRDVSSKRKRTGSHAQLARLKQRLADLLARPLNARGISQKYITSSARPGFVQALLHGESTCDSLTSDAPNMLGLRSSTAQADIAASQKKRQRT